RWDGGCGQGRGVSTAKCGADRDRTQKAGLGDTSWTSQDESRIVFRVCVAGLWRLPYLDDILPNGLRDHQKFGSLYGGLPDPKLLDSETNGFQPDLRSIQQLIWRV